MFLTITFDRSLRDLLPKPKGDLRVFGGAASPREAVDWLKENAAELTDGRTWNWEGCAFRVIEEQDRRAHAAELLILSYTASDPAGRLVAVRVSNPAPAVLEYLRHLRDRLEQEWPEEDAPCLLCGAPIHYGRGHDRGCRSYRGSLEDRPPIPLLERPVPAEA